MLLELLPDAKNVGILYCSAEANSVYQADVVKAALEAKGVNVTVYTFADSNDVATVTQTACAENDALYIPTDNTAASCTEAINNVAEPAGVPIVAGEEGICKGCGIATLSIDYYELGRTTGRDGREDPDRRSKRLRNADRILPEPCQEVRRCPLRSAWNHRSVRLRCNRLTRNQTERR